MKKFQIVFLTVSAISACLNATTTPIELAVESGTATFSTSFLGLLRKTGAGILMLTGINSLTRLDIEEGTVLVCCKDNLNNLGVDIPIRLSNLGTIQSQDTGMFITGAAGGTTIYSLTLFFGEQLMVNEGIVSLGPQGKLPSSVCNILGNTVLKLAAGGSAGAISSVTHFGEASQLHITANVTPGTITGPVFFDSGATVILSDNTSDAGILGEGGSYTFSSGAKIVLGKGSCWTSNISML